MLKLKIEFKIIKNNCLTYLQVSVIPPDTDFNYLFQISDILIKIIPGQYVMLLDPCLCRSAFLSLWYAYLWGYVRRYEGVREKNLFHNILFVLCICV